jgi:four helix bundle protein
MVDNLENARYYALSMELWDNCWKDTEILNKDFRGREIAKQLIRAVGSISANIEEGYGRGFGKEFPHFLRISRGSARESKGWYRRAKFLLNEEIIKQREESINAIIAILTKTIKTLQDKNKPQVIIKTAD